MAIFHFTSKIVGRRSNDFAKTTRDTVAALAYRTGTNLCSAFTGERSDYSGKSVAHVELLHRDDVPSWVHDLKAEIAENREAGVQHFSDVCELAEKRVDSQVYRECEFALPHELTDEQNYELTRLFVHDQFTKQGMLALASFHMDVDEKTGQKKPHCHLLLSMRNVTDLGFSEYKNRSWNATEHLQSWRESWAFHVNQYCKALGLEVNIDHRSYEEQGFDIEPQLKRGRNIQEMQAKGMRVDKLKEWDSIRMRNLYRIISKPDVILDIVSKQKAAFTQLDIQKVLLRYVEDRDLFDRLSAKIFSSSRLIHLNERLYTTPEMIKLETTMLQTAQRLRDAPHPSGFSEIGPKHLCELNTEQQEALKDIVSSHQLKTLIGYAGTGKTKLLAQATSLWQQEGVRVVGLAPTGKAADNMAQLGIPSFILHKFLKDYEEGKSHYHPRTVLILDEASMVDAGLFDRFLKAVDHLGVKTILVGDTRQLQSIGAGDAFRLVSQITNPHILSHIMRQKVKWQQQATLLFGIGETEKGLALYDKHDCIQMHESSKEGMKECLNDWIHSLIHNSDKLHTILAHTNKDVDSLNTQARRLLKECGMLDSKDHIFTTIKLQEDDWGKLQVLKVNKAFAKGDRIVFTRNDNSLGIKNGMMGKILSLDKQTMSVELEHSQETVTFAPNLYPYFDQGWATSIHKSQGSTFEHVFVWISKWMYQNLTYVALTRHKESVRVYGSEEDFSNKQDLTLKLSRVQDKVSSLDHLNHLSVEQVEALIKQDDKILAPLFDKLQNHLEAIGFVTKEAFAHVKEKYFTHPDSVIQNSGMIQNYDEQTQTHPIAKDTPQLGGGSRLDQGFSEKLVDAPLDVLQGLKSKQYLAFAKAYCLHHYGFEQVDVYDEDRLSFAQFVKMAKGLSRKNEKALEVFLHTRDQTIKEMAKELRNDGLSKELAHIAATAIHDHERMHQKLNKSQTNAFVDHMKDHAHDYNKHAQKVSALLKDHGAHIDNHKEYKAYQENLTHHYSLQTATHALHHICHSHEMHHDMHHEVQKQIEQHLQQMLHQELQKQLEMTRSRGMGMEM